MALEDMLRALEEEGQAECDKIMSQAKAREKEILKEAKEEASVIKEAHMKKVKAALRSERARIISNATFYVKKEVLKAKEELIKECFNEAAKRLEVLRSSPQYEKIFADLAKEALANTEGEVVVSVDKRDAKLAERVLGSLTRRYKLTTNLKCLGGLVVTTGDGRITFINTFDSRLAKARKLLRSEITSVLFG
jgi:V/A-type H+-transporting ATPase subunit E